MIVSRLKVVPTRPNVPTQLAYVYFSLALPRACILFMAGPTCHYESKDFTPATDGTRPYSMPV